MAPIAGLELEDIWDAILCARYPEATRVIAPRQTADRMILLGQLVSTALDTTMLAELPTNGAKNAIALEQLELAKPHVTEWKALYVG